MTESKINFVKRFLPIVSKWRKSQWVLYVGSSIRSRSSKQAEGNIKSIKSEDQLKLRYCRCSNFASFERSSAIFAISTANCSSLSIWEMKDDSERGKGRNRWTGSLCKVSFQLSRQWRRVYLRGALWQEAVPVKRIKIKAKANPSSGAGATNDDNSHTFTLGSFTLHCSLSLPVTWPLRRAENQ